MAKDFFIQVEEELNEEAEDSQGPEDFHDFLNSEVEEAVDILYLYFGLEEEEDLMRFEEDEEVVADSKIQDYFGQITAKIVYLNHLNYLKQQLGLIDSPFNFVVFIDNLHCFFHSTFSKVPNLHLLNQLAIFPYF